jgi:peptidoglycan/xylan/chitin deacetylase (PgdA/CDA1 family)
MLAILHTLLAFAVGPEEIAISNQSLWPDPIVDHSTYDAASRAEILLFLRAYGANSTGDDGSTKAWRDRSSQYWLSTYQAAATECAHDHEITGCGFKGSTFPELLAFAEKFPARLSPRFTPWLVMSQNFYRIYVAEQKRLAGLFPDPTSEILPVSDSEIIGDRFQDGSFLLSFDAGPTPLDSDSDHLLPILEKNGLHAQFFTLGNMLQPRIEASSIPAVDHFYGTQCLGSHGQQHLSHQKWADWKSSLTNSWALIQKIRPGSKVPFRPPFGQRTAELVAEQKRLAGASVILWNIDSQDWNDNMPLEKVGDRVKKLMMLWRKGIILMHDVHPKAPIAVPDLLHFASSAGLSWVDCHSLRQ